MIGKKHDPPIYLHKLSVLMTRLSPQHPRYEDVKEQRAMQQAGHLGERSLDFPLSFLEEKRFMVYHDLRLSDGIHHFQIDTLVLSQHYLLILEVKNISGILTFDPTFNQMIRFSETREEAFPNPLTQVERQRSQLKSLLDKLKIPVLPIETLIVVSNQRTVLKATHDINAVSSKVIRSEYLPTKVMSLDKHHPGECLTMKEVRKLGRSLVKLHEPMNRDVLKRFSISPSELLVGVACPECSRLAMRRLHGRWYCERCGISSKDAHLQALQDYALLVSREITNQELRRFLRMASEDAATRLLRSLNLESTGENKARRYKLNIRHF